VDITHLGHAAVLVETGDARILIDPGNMEAQWHELVDLDAVLVTHQHADHLDPARFPGLIKANPGAALFVEPSIIGLAGTEVTGVGTVPEMPTARPLPPGDKISIGALTITGVGGQHAIIHRDIPQIGNVGYLISGEGEPTFFHPGDSYEDVPEGVDVLAFPSYGPWAAMKEGIDFAREVGATRGFPIHDALLSEPGRNMIVARISAMTPTQLTDLRGAGPTAF
jgi:L-ascorbate metabolism protein UlaG (beta-lactamase superfamily)